MIRDSVIRIATLSMIFVAAGFVTAQRTENPTERLVVGTLNLVHPDLVARVSADVGDDTFELSIGLLDELVSNGTLTREVSDAVTVDLLAGRLCEATVVLFLADLLNGRTALQSTDVASIRPMLVADLPALDPALLRLSGCAEGATADSVINAIIMQDDPLAADIRDIYATTVSPQSPR